MTDPLEGRLTQGYAWHWVLAVIFVVLNVADLALTWVLVHESGRAVGEGNPIAKAWLDSYGWPGLIFFKGTLCILVLTLVIMISRRRPAMGIFVLLLGVVLLACVVGYQAVLLQVRPWEQQ